MVFFHVTTISVTTSGGLTNFTDKLPGRAKRITGVMLSASATHNTQAICQVGISINGGKEYPINQLITSRSTDPLTKSYPLRFNIQHDRNSLITGYIEDLGPALSYPYTVKITFMLEDDQ